jgi:hypothetical protein
MVILVLRYGYDVFAGQCALRCSSGGEGGDDDGVKISKR